MSGITPAKKVEILRLSMLYGHASIIVACPHRRTMFEGILVLSLSTLYGNVGIAVACPYRRTMFEGILVLSLSTLYDQYF